MQVIDNVQELRAWNLANRDHRRALVPTMGALHAGHLSLCDKAREAVGTNGKVVATIFVNPTQFGPNEDLDAYPRQLEADLAGCREHGVDLVFAPAAEAMYFPDASIEIEENQLSLGLCGDSRPGHFNGVCTVVTKLFNLTSPDVAVFGEKDYQQLAVIRRMARDLNFPIEIVGGETVREPDGLAMSSRNLYLTEEQRKEAPVIYRSLCEARDAIAKGELTTAAQTKQFLAEKIGESAHANIDYLEVVDPDTLQALDRISKPSYRIIVAVFFGKPRLIDNLGPII